MVAVRSGGGDGERCGGGGGEVKVGELESGTNPGKLRRQYSA